MTDPPKQDAMHPTPIISLDWPHRVSFTRRAFDPANPALANALNVDADAPGRLLVAVDQGVVHANPHLQRDLERYLEHHRDAGRVLPELVGFRTVPPGEPCKNDLSNLENFLSEIDKARLCRHSFVLVLGGGAVLDMVGFAAAIAHRGVRLVRMPTTTLAQCDSGVGVKNSVNMFGKKNFLGSFAVPWAVVNDLSLLETLDDREWRSGLSEAVKVALLKDVGLYKLIASHAGQLARRDVPFADGVLQRSAWLHLDHIAHGGDPFEATTARPLDFGHWSAHKLEQITQFAVKHGEAVAIGLALDVTYCELMGMLDPATAQGIRDTLTAIGFDLWHPALEDADTLLAGLEEFREHLGGQLTITLIQAVGQPVDVHTIDRPTMAAALGQLREAYAGTTTC
ncbi:MAG: 3-dehydroquinate synthase [Phycisphaerales bacterium JB063]